MVEPGPRGERNQELSVEVLRRIDSACDQFEDAWSRGKRPQLQDYLEWCPAAEQNYLLEALAQLQEELARKQAAKVEAAETLSSESDPANELGVFLANHERSSKRDAVKKSHSRQCRFVFHVNSGPNEGQQFVYEECQTLVVGRSQSAHLRLADDPSFSRQQFQLEITHNNCRLTDLSSHNGTRVNGKRVKVKTLKDGDVITVGQTEIQVSIVNPNSGSWGM